MAGMVVSEVLFERSVDLLSESESVDHGRLDDSSVLVHKGIHPLLGNFVVVEAGGDCHIWITEKQM